MRILPITCSTLCAAAMGAASAATVFGSRGVFIIPFLIENQNQPEVANEILNKFIIVTVAAATLGAGLGVLVEKVARFAYQKITSN